MRQVFRDVLGAEFSFEVRNIPLLASLRPTRRLALLVLSLRYCCYADRSSFKRLHILNWALRTDEARKNLLALLGGNLDPDEVFVRFEPSFGRVIDLGLGINLLHAPRGDRVQLTSRGREVADSIKEMDECLVEEKRYLEELGSSLTENKVNSILKGTQV